MAVDDSNPTGHQDAALEHLRRALGGDAPSRVEHAATYDGHPLENEGVMSVFRFRAAVGGSPEMDYYVIAGETETNYYPCWELSADDAYSLHLGTRFMLVMKVSQLAGDSVPQDFAEGVRTFIGTVAPTQPIGHIAVAAAFRVGGEVYAVFRTRIGPEPVYVLGLDCPPGIYRDVDLTPHVILRRHLGRLIRREAETDSQP